MLPKQSLKDNEKNQTSINKHSALIAIQNRYTLSQRKLINPLLLIALLSLKKHPSQQTFTVKISDLRKYAVINNTNIKTLKEDLRILRKQEIKFNFFDKSNDKRWDCFGFLADVTMKDGILEYSFPRQIKETMLFPEMYAKINLNLNGLFESIYSLVIYEYAKDYINVSIPIMELDNFREFLGIRNKYKEIGNLKRRVLNVAVDEINKKTDISIGYKLIKSGLKFTHIKFTASESRSVLKVLPSTSSKIADTSVSNEFNRFIYLLPEKLRRMKKTRVLIDEYLTDRGADWVKSNIDYFNDHSTKKNFPYLKIVFENDSGEENRVETELKAKKIKKVAKVTRKNKEDKSKAKTEFAALVDRAEKYFNSLQSDKQEAILKEISNTMIFVPPGYKKKKNLGAKLKSYFELKNINFKE